MKKYILLLIIPFLGFGQTLNNIPISELDAKYIQIVGTQKLLKMYEVTINVNYGQVGKFKDANKSIVYDASGKPMTFNGMMDAVNLFSNYGYKLEMAYPVSTGQSNIYHYIMYNENANNLSIKNIGQLLCDCYEAVNKAGDITTECQELFKEYKTGTEAGKLRFENDLEKYGCE